MEGYKKDFQKDFTPAEARDLRQLLAGEAPKGMSLYSRVSKVRFGNVGVGQVYIKDEAPEKKDTAPVNGFDTEKIDRLLARVGVDEDDAFYRELGSVIYSLGRDAENPRELRYAYGLLMEGGFKKSRTAAVFAGVLAVCSLLALPFVRQAEPAYVTRAENHRIRQEAQITGCISDGGGF